MAEEIINIQIVEQVDNINITIDEVVENVAISIQEPSQTSDLVNNGSDGVHPFITAANIPAVNDATTTVKGIIKLAGDLSGTADLPTIPALSNKVDKVTGKELSTNDFTNTLKTKLDGIADGAEVNVNADWNATSGDAQILNKPTIPAAQVNSDWNATSGVAQILNKPSLTGFGDMLKSTYDTDNTGVVDNAEAIKIIGRNSTGSTLYRGTVIYISGSTGNRPNFVKSRANTESTSAGTFGVIADDLPNNTDGYALALGYLDNLDTRTNAAHPFTADTLADGDTIYLSPTTAGYITNVKPSAPDHLVYLGKVTRTSPTNGTIVYRIQNGYELEELHNVAISSVEDKQLLSYDNATSLWKNKSVTTADIAASTNKNYVTDAQATIIGNTSGTNTGDETTATIKSKLGAANTSNDGYLTSTNWNTFNKKLGGLQVVYPVTTGQGVTPYLVGNSSGSTTGVANRIYLIPLTPSNSFTSSSFNIINVTGAIAGSNVRVLIYSDLNGKPDGKLYESADISTATTGIKTISASFSFVAGTTYWYGLHYSSSPTLTSFNGNSLPIISTAPAATTTYFQYTITATFGSAPANITTSTIGGNPIAYINITVA